MIYDPANRALRGWPTAEQRDFLASRPWEGVGWGLTGVSSYAEAAWLGAPVKHVADWEDHQRVKRIYEQSRKAARYRRY